MSRDAEIEELKRLVKGLAAEVKALKAKQDVDEFGLTPERRLAIKMIARADAAGDPGPRREWNRQRRKEFEAERLLQTSRS
ncbi:MAG: hypothetical protein ACE5GY_10735 [Thermodesulfobacteriota bacterium]